MGYALLFMVGSLILFGIGDVFLRHSICGKDHQIVSEKINTYANIAVRSGIDNLVQELERTRAQNERLGFFVRVEGNGGRILSQTLPRSWNPFPPELAQTPLPFVEDEWVVLEHPRSSQVALSRPDTLDIAGRLLPDGTRLQVGYSTRSRARTLQQYQGIFFVILGPIVLLGIAGGIFLSRRALKPVRDLTAAIQSVRAGQMEARVPLGDTVDELQELARQFNAMLDSIATLMNGMREALDNVAHDLRTPLTRMRTSIETVMQDEPDAQTLREALLDCAEESQQITRMLTTLMDISEAETGVMHLSFEAIDLAGLIESIHTLYQYAAEEKGIMLETIVSSGMMAWADTARLRQALSNLVDNAVKYTPPGGRVTVVASENESVAEISVSDTGPGIASADLPRIFDRLYRGDKSRSERGLGLGLCLVKAIAAAHRGTITVVSHPGQGAVFTLALPMQPGNTTEDGI